MIVKATAACIYVHCQCQACLDAMGRLEGALCPRGRGAIEEHSSPSCPEDTLRLRLVVCGQCQCYGCLDAMYLLEGALWPRRAIEAHNVLLQKTHCVYGWLCVPIVNVTVACVGLKKNITVAFVVIGNATVTCLIIFIIGLSTALNHLLLSQRNTKPFGLCLAMGNDNRTMCWLRLLCCCVRAYDLFAEDHQQLWGKYQLICNCISIYM